MSGPAAGEHGGVTGTPGGTGSARVEAWNEPDAVLPSSSTSVATMPKRTGTPSRLGVLPSPTANTHAQAEEEVAKGKGGHGPSASIDAKAVEPVADGGVAVGGEDGDLSGSKLAQRESGLRDDDDAFQVETDMKAGEGDAPVLSTSQTFSI